MANKRRPDGERGSASRSGADQRPWPEQRPAWRKRRVGTKADDRDGRDPAEVRASSVETKARSTGGQGGAGKAFDDDDMAMEEEEEEEELAASDEEEIADDATADMPLEREGGSASKGRHIHPCVCDLTKRQRQRIEAYLRHKRTMQRKYEKRVKQIEAELSRLEDERMERERELQEQQELFGDEYELVGKKKKRKKRSARRASMVSLGVKQVINWRKPPRIEVKMTTASSLRQKYSSYCGRLLFPLSPVAEIDYRKEPELAIRATLTSSARAKVNVEKKAYLIEHEDKRKIFETPYYV